jgi:hypothetical protein
VEEKMKQIRRVLFALALGSGMIVWNVGADSVDVAPSPDEVIAQSWFGICGETPYAVYQLTIKKDGTAKLLYRDHEGVLIRWDVTQWKLTGKELQLVFAPNKNWADQLAGSGVIDVHTPLIILTTRWANRKDLPEQKVMLLSESQIKDSVKVFDSDKKDAPNKTPEDTARKFADPQR